MFLKPEGCPRHLGCCWMLRGTKEYLAPGIRAKNITQRKAQWPGWSQLWSSSTWRGVQGRWRNSLQEPGVRKEPLNHRFAPVLSGMRHRLRAGVLPCQNYPTLARCLNQIRGSRFWCSTSIKKSAKYGGLCYKQPKTYIRMTQDNNNSAITQNMAFLEEFRYQCRSWGSVRCERGCCLTLWALW